MADGPPDGPRWVDDPYAPHDTTGANLRLGSAVGQVSHDGRSYTALGAAIAAGPRVGRVTFEADYLFLNLSAPGPSSLRYGRTQRLGAMARIDVVRLGSRWVGANSMLALYGEAGVARQWYQWRRPGLHEPSRVVPVDATAVTGVVGFGINLDHRLEKPLGFPNRVGWQLGWQLASTAARQADATIACLGPTCTARPSTMATAHNTSLIVTSTIGFTW